MAENETEIGKGEIINVARLQNKNIKLRDMKMLHKLGVG